MEHQTHPVTMCADNLVSLLERVDANLQPGIPIVIMWQGGEPLLAGRAYFKIAADAVQRLRATGRPVQVEIQTNGVLVDQVWGALFRDLDASMRVSLDGPQEIHDALRYDLHGKGTFIRVLRGIHTLLETGLRVQGLLTLTALHIDKLDDVFDLYASLGLALHPQPFLAAGGGSANCCHLSLPNGGYAQAFLAFADRWLLDSDVPPYPAFERLLRWFAKKDLNKSDTTTTCGNILAVAPDGKASLCFRMLSVPEAIIGDAFRETPSMLAVRAFRTTCIQRRQQGPCMTCEYAELCGGGCAHNAWCATGLLDAPDPLCADYRAIYSGVQKRLERAINVVAVIDRRK